METVFLKSDEIQLTYLAGDACSEINHCHEHYEIMYVMCGSGKYIVEGSELDLKKRVLIISRPLAYHIVRADESTTYESYVLHFPRHALSEDAAFMLDNLISDGENGRYFAPDMLSESLISTFERFEFAKGLPKSEMRAYTKALLSEIIILLSAASGEKMTFTDDELGARVIRYLNNNIEKNISLETLARRFFVSKYHLCRAFKKYSGISVHSYINHKRIMYAKQLISAGETAQSAAYKVGFGDYSAFYRAYVKIVGKSPRAERTREET